jgi:uncharacterized protein (DUF2062 family)
VTILANNQLDKKNNNKDAKIYRSPLKTLWGKILIWALCLAMVLGIVVALIWNLVKMYQGV